MAAVMLRAVPWSAVTGLTALAAVMGGCGVVLGGAQTLLAIAFALLAAAAAFVLDEPAAAVVDVTPTGPDRRAGVRALALALPLGTGAVLVLAGAWRGAALPWGAVGVALAGSVLLGFALACVVRRRIGEPGVVASPAAAFVLIGPGFFPPAARLVHMFPAAGREGWSSNACWGMLGCVCLAAIAVAVTDRRPRTAARRN